MRLFTHMMKELQRLEGFKKHVNMDGAIDWQKIGVYKIKKQDTGLVIMHCSGATAEYPKHLRADIGGIPLEKNTNDMLAALKFPNHPFYLKDAFAKDSGPQLLLIVNARGLVLKDLADKFEAEISAVEAAAALEATKAVDLTAELSKLGTPGMLAWRSSLRASPTGQ